MYNVHVYNYIYNYMHFLHIHIIDTYMYCMYNTCSTNSISRNKQKAKMEKIIPLGLITVYFVGYIYIYFPT